MMTIICMLFLLVAPSFAAEPYTPHYECSNDEELGHKSCNNCEPSCDNLYPEACTKIGCESCDCVPGLVRDKSSKKCVPKEKCPAPQYPCLCPVGEEPGQKSCQMCEPSCDNPKPERCAQTFAPCNCSCDCVPGLLRDKVSKKCVPKEKCPAPPYPCLCPENEQPGQKSCNLCEPSCDNLNPEKCTTRFCECSCDCVPGFVRDKVSKQCVPNDKCPYQKKEAED